MGVGRRGGLQRPNPAHSTKCIKLEIERAGHVQGTTTLCSSGIEYAGAVAGAVMSSRHGQITLV